MSIWSSVVSKFKEGIRKMIGANTIEKTIQASPILSRQMENAISLWSAMYSNHAPWLKDATEEDPVRIASLGLPALIASEKARTALLEFESEITAPNVDVETDKEENEKEVIDDSTRFSEPTYDGFGDMTPTADPAPEVTASDASHLERAKYLNQQYVKLKRQLRKQLEYGIAKGGLVIKPYLVSNTVDGKLTDWQMEFDFIQADNFYPLAFDASGRITEAAFIQTLVEGDTVYRRLEYHKWETNVATIINKAFKSSDKHTTNRLDLDLGQEIELTDVSSWKDLQPEVQVKNIQRPLFAYFKMPEANTVDTSSPLGVSGYSRAVSLIKDADMQYSRLLWEYEAGEMAVDIDRNAFTQTESLDGKTHSVRPILQQRLFRQVDLGVDNTYQPFAPALRDNAYLQGLNAILMRIEDIVGFGRGTLSDVAQEAKTATEIKILKQRSYQSNADIQSALESTLKDTVYIMDAYCELYNITPSGEYDVSFTWDDSIIVDADTELAKRITLLQNGLTSKREVRQWYFGETERQAREALQEIEEEAQNDMEKSLVMKPYEPKNVPGMPKDLEI